MLLRSPGPVGGDQHGHLVRVPVVGIPGGELEVPQQLTRGAAQRHDGVGIQIVAQAAARIEIRLGIADAPIHDVGLGIVGTGHPGAGAADPPRLPRPGIMARLPGRGDRFEPPASFARPGVVGDDESPAVARRGPDTGDDQSVQRQRRCADVGRRIGGIDHCFPHQPARIGLQRRQLRVPRADIDPVIQQGYAAILADRSLAAADAFIGMLVHP